MADQIKELIKKIQEEGVGAAQQEARKIQQDASQQAQAVLEKANSQAKKILEEAEEKIKRLEASSQSTLKQAGRDLLLSLKKEIMAMLERLIAAEVRAALTPEELAKIIATLIKEYCRQEHKEIIIYLKEEDRDKLEKHFLNKLKGELKKGIELRGEDSIHAGFVISFDAGKSHFDFSDKALALYLGSYLKPKAAELFKDSK